MLDFLRKLISDRNPLRLLWHWAWAVLAAVVYRFPARHLKIIFVTGTKGKTTTTWSIGSLLQACGVKTAVSTTALYRLGDKVWANESKMTTLGRFGLQKFLRQAVESGCAVAVVEVSSQALTQSRLWGVRGIGMVWTNLQNDHLEYHGGWENYRAAKGKLLAQVRAGGFAVLNADDAEFGWFAEQAQKYNLKVWSVGEKNANYTLKNFVFEERNLSFEVGDLGRFEANFSGKFNIQNLAEAVLAVRAYGFEIAKIREILPKIKPVPGRLEVVENPLDLNLCLDFAYTPKALEEGLKALRAKMRGGELWVMFGAVAGGRDARKRPEMGLVAEKLADRVVLTDDDLGPDDDSAQVIAGIISGFSAEYRAGQKWRQIVPREQAVEFILQNAKKGDWVLFAGKGCEQVQHFGSRQRPYNERKVIEITCAKIKKSIEYKQ